MKLGQGSKTAMLVCMGRAVADADASLPEFSDPTAFTLLPDEARERVVRDQGLPEIGERMSAKIAETTKVAKHLRIVTATRA